MWAEGLSDPLVTLGLMGEVVWLEERRLVTRRGRGRVRAADHGLERLDRAVARLGALVGKVRANRGTRIADVEAELLALCGAVSLDRFEEAAELAERLAARLVGAGGTGG